MAINKETQRNITAIVSKEVYEKYKELCVKHKRSASNLTAILIEKFIEESTKQQALFQIISKNWLASTAFIVLLSSTFLSEEFLALIISI